MRRRRTVAEYFGEPWDAPALDDATWVPTPVGEQCEICHEAIVSGDRGWIRGAVRTVSGLLAASTAVLHAECEVLTIVGHSVGVCFCTGYGHTRAAALEAWDRLNRLRTAEASESQRPDVSQSNATARKPVGYVAFDPSNIDLRGFGYVPADTNAIFPTAAGARAAVEDYDGPASVYALVPAGEEEGTGQ